MLYGGKVSLTRISIKAIITSPEGLVLTYSPDIEKFTLPGVRLFAEEEATEENLRRALGIIGLRDRSLLQLAPLDTEVCAAPKLEPTQKNDKESIIYSRWLMWGGAVSSAWQPPTALETNPEHIEIFTPETARNHPKIGHVARTAIIACHQAAAAMFEPGQLVRN